MALKYILGVEFSYHVVSKDMFGYEKHVDDMKAVSRLWVKFWSFYPWIL